MTSNGTAEYIVDADGHLCEPADLWERNLLTSMRARGIRLRWNEATGFEECLVEDTMANERGLVGPEHRARGLPLVRGCDEHRR